MNFPSLSSIGHNLRTQDNRITDNPIFYVQQKHRITGLEEGYSYDYVWVDSSSEQVDDETAEALEAATEHNRNPENHPTGIIIDNYRKVYYRDEWVNVQPFFSEQGAKDYIAINGHNLREPRIYVDSAYRNAEWQAVRAFLMGLPEGGWKS